MEWLTKLPWIGPLIARGMRTHAWRSFEHLQVVHWTRLAAAVTFTSFLAFFPLLTLCAAIGAALLSAGQLKQLQGKIAQQVPGIASQLDLQGLVNNAGTVGVIAGALLLLTGVSWVGSLRDVLRAVWAKDQEPQNPFLRKLLDGAVLFGFGGVALVSLGASAFATAAVGWAADHLGLSRQGPAGLLLTAAGFCIAVLADFVLVVFLLTLLPGVQPPRRAVVIAGLIGAVGVELLKVLISGYLRQVAAKSMYGAFGVPVALLLWFNFIAKLMLFCAAWTATAGRAGGKDAESAPQASP